MRGAIWGPCGFLVLACPSWRDQEFRCCCRRSRAVPEHVSPSKKHLGDGAGVLAAGLPHQGRRRAVQRQNDAVSHRGISGLVTLPLLSSSPSPFPSPASLSSLSLCHPPLASCYAAPHAETKLSLCFQEYDPWKSSDRICRQLIYHLTPHSKWHRHGMPRRKSQVCLQKKVSQDSMDLSGIPLTMRDVHRMAYYLQNNGDHLTSVDLSFTELNDDMVRLLLPFLWALPKLTHLSLNGNRLTRATMKELTDTMKDMNKFPCLAWVDLGNNVDVSSMPQPLLVGLRKRLSQQTTLPTIYEALDCDSEISSGQEGSQLEDEAAGSTPPLDCIGWGGHMAWNCSIRIFAV
uniref:Leucine rich repeat containing 75B n=1 Tax=Anas platyrhynchos platyrhynchos TaxID=8840 RepID=U3IM58_ANAPP